MKFTDDEIMLLFGLFDLGIVNEDGSPVDTGKALDCPSLYTKFEAEAAKRCLVFDCRFNRRMPDGSLEKR